MKNKMTVERMKELVQEFIVMEKDETENSTEWAYVMLEPALLECEDVTLNYFKQIDKEEFNAIGDNHWFEDVLCKFQSVELLNTIISQYVNFYGEDKTTDFYQNSIKGLHNCIK